MNNLMKLSDFISKNLKTLILKWEAISIANSSVSKCILDEESRNHAELLLMKISKDLDKNQSNELISDYLKLDTNLSSSSKSYIDSRFQMGYSTEQLVYEFSSIRMCVIKKIHEKDNDNFLINFKDISLFNEIVDQTSYASIAHFSDLQKTFQQNLLKKLGHELRNPLNVVMVGAQILTRYEDVDEKVLLTASRIYKSSNQINEYISELLESDNNS